MILGRRFNAEPPLNFQHAMTHTDRLTQLLEHYAELAAIISAVPPHNDGEAQAKYLSAAAGALSTINELWAECKYILSQERAVASEEFTGEKYAKLPKRVVENMVDGRCGLAVRVEALMERLSRSAVHSIEAARSLLSNCKAERYAARY